MADPQCRWDPQGSGDSKDEALPAEARQSWLRPSMLGLDSLAAQDPEVQVAYQRREAESHARRASVDAFHRHRRLACGTEAKAPSSTCLSACRAQPLFRGPSDALATSMSKGSAPAPPALREYQWRSSAVYRIAL